MFLVVLSDVLFFFSAVFICDCDWHLSATAEKSGLNVILSGSSACLLEASACLVPRREQTGNWKAGLGDNSLCTFKQSRGLLLWRLKF